MNPTLTISKKNAVALFLIVLLGLVFGCVFSGAVGTIIQSWDKEEYSYAFLVAPIALLLILHRLAKTPTEPQPSWLGAGMVGAGLVVHLFGHLSGITVFPQYGFILAFWGLFYALLGRKVFASLLGELAYLFFAIPLPTTLYISLSAKLQLLSSMLGTDMLQLLGFAVYREGNVIDMGLYKLQVVEACSGLRYIFPLLGFSYLVAYFYKDAFWKRVVVFISALPLAVFLNIARITFIGITVNYWGVGAAEGLLHEFEGWVVFGVCIMLLFAEVYVLRFVGKTKGELDLSALAVPLGPYFSKPVKIGGVFAVILCVFGLVGLGQASGYLAPKAEVIPARQSFVAFPSEIGGWRATFESLKEQEIQLLRLSDYLNASFAKDDGQAVHLFVAYYNSQRNKNDLHSPEMCLPGSGWQARSTKTHRMKLTPDGRGVDVVRTVVEKGSTRQIVYYWFEQAGHSDASRLGIKGRTIVNSLSTGRTDSALLRLGTVLSPQETEAEADNRIQSFFAEAFPQLQPFIPDFTLD